MTIIMETFIISQFLGGCTLNKVTIELWNIVPDKVQKCCACKQPANLH
jgi:hypothetical protein